MKRIFFTIFLLLALAGAAWGATNYVIKDPLNPNKIRYLANTWPAADGSDGTGDTDIEAALSSAGSGGTLVISGGTSGLTYSTTEIDATDLLDTTAANQTIRGAITTDINFAEHNGTVNISGSGVDDYVLSITHAGCVVSGLSLSDAGANRYNLRIYGATASVVATSVVCDGGNRHLDCETSSAMSSFTHCSFQNTTNTTLSSYLQNDPTLNFNYCMFVGNYAMGLNASWMSGANITLNNCVFWGNGLGSVVSGSSGVATMMTLNNCILSCCIGPHSTSSSAVTTLRSLGSTAPITANNCLILPNSLNGNYVITSNVTVNSEIYGRPAFISPRRPGIARLALTIDDMANYTLWTQIADYVHARGGHASFGLNGGFSNWTGLQTYVAQGHEAVLHGWTHADLNNLNAFTMQYVGAGSSCTMSITANVLTSVVTGGPGSENLSYDLTAANYDTISELVSAIDGLAAYTATASQNIARSKTLSDVAGIDIRTAPYQALLDNGRFYDLEITDLKTLVESNLTGFVATSLIWPSNLYSDVAITAAKSRGVLGARTGDVASASMGTHSLESINIYKIAGIFASELGTDQITIQRSAGAVVEQLDWQGGIGVIWGHGEVTLQNWEYIIDAFLSHGIEIVTLKDLIAYAKSLTVDSGDGITYTKTFTDNIDWHLQKTSPCINAGTDTPNQNTAGLTDYDGRNWRMGRHCDIGAYEYPDPWYWVAHGNIRRRIPWR